MNENLSFGCLFVSEEAYSTFVYAVSFVCATLAIIFFLCLISSFIVDLLRYKIHLPKRKWVVIIDTKSEKQDQ